MARSGKQQPAGRVRFARIRDGSAPVPFVCRRVEELRSARLREVFAIWQGKRRDADPLPRDEDFDILDYGVAMGRINLLSVQQDPLDFLFRVHCVEGANYIGKDLTGLSVDDYPEPQYRDFVRTVFTEAALSRKPQIVIEDMFITDNRLMRWEGMVLPLQDGAATVSTLLVAFELLR